MPFYTTFPFQILFYTSKKKKEYHGFHRNIKHHNCDIDTTTLIKIRNVASAPNQHIKMISK